MNSNELLDALKKFSDVPSDYALAKKILKVDVTAIRNMRERGLSEDRALQIATLLGIDPGEVLATIRAERADDPAVKKVWEKVAKTIKSAAASLLIAIGIAGTAPEPLKASGLTADVIHYAKYRLRRAWAALLGILACLGLSVAPVYADNWTKADTARQLTFTALQVIDWGQTRNIVNRRDTGCDGDATCIERNPFLGERPSMKRVDAHFALTTLANFAISYALPPDWREAWQHLSIGVEAGIIGYNYKIGLKMDF